MIKSRLLAVMLCDKPKACFPYLSYNKNFKFKDDF